MKPRLKNRFHFPLSTAIFTTLSFFAQASAADVTWDTVPSDSTVTGGLGIWDTSTANWTTNGGFSNLTWINGTDTAIFGGVAGAVTLGELITAGGLTFNTTGYSLLGNQTITLSGASPTITVNATTVNIGSSANATIIAGSAGLTKAGPGQLVMISSAANTYTGDTNVNAGQLGVNFQTVATNMIDPSSNLVMNGGAFSVLARNNLSTSQSFSNTTVASGNSVFHVNKQSAVLTNIGLLNLGAITRNAGATANFFTSGNGLTTRQIQSSSFVSGQITTDSGVAYATFQNSAISSATPSFTGDDWASYDGSTVVAPAYTESTASTLSGNADLVTNTALAANTGLISLRKNLANTDSIDLGTNTLSTGGILIASGVGTNTTTITNGILKSAATAANKDLVIIANNTGITTLGATITNADAGVTGLTKSGPGNLTLAATNNYTGPTLINSGSLTSSLAAALDSTPSVSIGSGAALTVSYGGPSSYTNPQITALLAKTTFADATSGFGFDTTDATGGTADFAGGYSASTGLAKSGAGTLVLTGPNSHTGTTSVFGGTLKVLNTGALGGTSHGTVVSNGAAVSIEGGIAIIGESLSIQGDGISQTGALHSISGSNFWTGAISSPGTARINADAGTLNLSEIGPSGILILSGDGDITVNLVSGTAGITVEDLIGDGSASGTMTLDGANTHIGVTTVASGRLDLTGNRTANSGGLSVGATAEKTGTLNISNGLFSTGTGDILIGTAADAVGVINQTAGTLSTTPTANNNGRVLIGSAPSSAGTYNLSGGTLNANGAGTNFGNANALILGTNSNSSGTFNLSGTGTLVIPDTFALLQIGRSNSSTVSSSGTFTQTGGTASICNLGMGGAANTSTTSILSISSGTFAVTNSFNTMAAGDNSSASITIGGDADVTLPAFPTARGTDAITTITFDGGILRPAAASLVYLENLTSATIQNGGATMDVAPGNDIVIAQNLLTHPSSLGGGLTKLGDGILGLSGVNTYTGMTNVNAGILGLNAGSSIAGAVTVASGATIAGSGTVSGALDSSGTIMPGIATVADIGTLTTGAATLDGGALAIDVSGPTADKFVTTGALVISASTTLNVTELLAATAPSYVIAEGTSRSGTFTVFNLPSGYSLTYNDTQVILNTPATGGYATWATDSGIDGELPEDDFDHDGLSNLVEYALDLDPTISTVPAGTFNGVTLAFTKGADAIANEDVSWVIQTSTTLGNDWVDQVTHAPGDAEETISYGLPPNQPEIFARLKVMKIP